MIFLLNIVPIKAIMEKLCSCCKLFLPSDMFDKYFGDYQSAYPYKTCHRCRRNGREYYMRRRPTPHPPKYVLSDYNKYCSGCRRHRNITDFERSRSKHGIPYEHKTCNFCHQKQRRNRMKSE